MQKSIKQFSAKYKNCMQLQEFEKTSRQFDLLVEKGTVEKRGYNLHSISDQNFKK